MKLKPCPFCGEDPECTTLGTAIEIWCCAHMSLFKSEFLTLEERQTWNNDTMTYSENAEKKAFEATANIWNTRVP